MLSLDWSHEKPMCIYDGTELHKIDFNGQFNEKKPSLDNLIELSKSNGSTIIVENLPHIYKKYLVDNGIKVLTIHPTTVKIYTTENGIRNNTDYEENSDEYDSKAIFVLYGLHPEYFFEYKINPKKEKLRELVKSYDDIMHLRVRLGNRQYSQGTSTEVKKLEEMETNIKKQIERQCELFTVYNNFLNRVEGIGPITSAYLLSYIDIEKAHNFSAMRKYCGMGVTDGKADRRIRGQTCKYNTTLKNVCYLIGEAFVKQNHNKYRELYDIAKRRYREKLPDDSDGHVHSMAKRTAVSQFLSDFYSQWRKLEGLSFSYPYVIKELGHEDYITDNPTKLEFIKINVAELK